MSEEIAASDSLLTQNAELRQKLFDAYKLIGRLDFFLETYASQSAAEQKRQAAKLRREIAASVTPQRSAPPARSRRVAPKQPTTRKK